jgi:hypothetical protein
VLIGRYFVDDGGSDKILQSCKHVIKCLQAGAFGGPLGVDEVDAYKQQLHRRFSSANWFAPPPSSLIDGCNVGTNGLAERAAAVS